MWPKRPLWSPGREGGAALFYSTLTLRFDPETSCFDDGPLDAFAKSRELLSVKDHFFTHGGLPHLLLCVSWRMPPSGSSRRPGAEEEWRGLLATPEQHDAFDRLRRWRNERAKREGKPPYAILTNRQTAEMAALPSPVLAALGRVEKFGPAKVERYGREILEVLGVPADG